MSIATAKPSTAPWSCAAAAPVACLAALVLANLGLLFGVAHTSLLWSWGLDVAAWGVVLSHVFLLALWLALGGQHWLVRLIVVAAPTLFLSRAINFRISDAAPWEESFIIAGVSLTAVLCFHAILVPLRWLGLLRLGFVSPPPDVAPGRKQFRIVHLLVWTIWCALPCGLARAVTPDHVFELIASLALVGAFVLPLAATTALLVLGRRRLLWLVAVAVAWGCTTALKQLIPDFFDTPRMWQFNLVVVATVGGNVALLRLCGLRLWCGTAVAKSCLS